MNNTATVENAGTAPATTTPEGQVAELESVVNEIRGAWSEIRALPAEVKTLKEGTDKLSGDLREVRRGLLTRAAAGAPRPRGGVSEECARHLAAQFIVHCERSDKLEALSSVSGQRDTLMTFARNTLNLTTRAALTATDINLPAQYGSEIRELISEFGVVRRISSARASAPFIPFAASVSSIWAPRSISILRRSSDIDSGITRIR